jgi:hypothetical protein
LNRRPAGTPASPRPKVKIVARKPAATSVKAYSIATLGSRVGNTARSIAFTTYVAATISNAEKAAGRDNRSKLFIIQSLYSEGEHL